MNARTTEEITSVIRTAVQAATWAPSVHNTQPWSFAVDGDEIALRADSDRKLRIGDPSGREMLISCGAALMNVRLALRALGYEPQVRVLPDPDRPALSAARLREQARRLDWGDVLDPFLTHGGPAAVADALSLVRWWR